MKSLGDVRAENDLKMLGAAFFVSADFRTLIEGDQKSIVVGRRGTGKSALYLKLSEHYSKQQKTELIMIAPEEHDVLALRAAVARLTNEFRTSRVVLKLALKCAILLELAERLERRYKFSNADGADYLRSRTRADKNSPICVFTRAREILKQLNSDDIIASALVITEISKLESAVISALEQTRFSVAILFDRTDEGYDPDSLGAAVIDGIAHSVIELQDKVPNCRSILFLRDNIYRALSKSDPDFSRNIEQSVLRLHWDEDALLSFICERLKIVRNIKAEKSLKIWDSVSVNDLKGKDGFRLCLRLTLYRPRDLLLLLNEGFRRAAKAGSDFISLKEISNSAKSISSNRLSDLDKEYSEHFPGLEQIISSFRGTQPEWSVDEIGRHIQSIIDREDLSPKIVQHFTILGDYREILRDLFSVGFIGIKDSSTGHFVFCHDGRNPDKSLADESRVLVHPCYWMALNFEADGLTEESAASIYDEYDVVVVSETPELRIQKIGRIEKALTEIEVGLADAAEFEQWCFDALRIIFAGVLSNMELRPNKANLQRRDIVATNLGGSPFWRRVKEDYSTRQVIFEIKNFKELGSAEFRQVLSYSGNDYGKFAIIVTRDEDINLRKDGELRWVRELRNQHGMVVLVINAKFICKLLHRLRSPIKHDAADKQMNSLLDQYVRVYFGENA